MKYVNDKASDIQIAYIGGGSRGWAWTFMTDLALEPALGGTIRLYDIDHAASKNNEIIGNKVSQQTEAVGKWEYKSIDTLAEALDGADFVVISTLTNTFDAMDVDVHMPERLGIYQSVGDTAGPGGMIRAMRTIPVYVEFAKAIRKYCPDAWVINYTNPMTLCVKTLYTVFPQIKAFGCCHEVLGTQRVLAGIMAEKLGVEKIDWRDILVNVLGINHFTWFDHASYKGYDLFPIYQEYIDKHFDEGYYEADANWMNASFCSLHRVKFDMFRRYGLIAAAGDRHLVEFLPGNEYLKDPETVKSWDFGLTTVDWRKNDMKQRLERSARLISGEDEIKLEPTGEEGVQLIKAICGLQQTISNVNIPNTNKQIANLPASAVVETNALFARDQIRPLVAGSLPENIHKLTIPHVENHERIMIAGLTHDRDLVVEAFLNDPLIQGYNRSRSEIEKLADDMLAETL